MNVHVRDVTGLSEAPPGRAAALIVLMLTFGIAPPVALSAAERVTEASGGRFETREESIEPTPVRAFQSPNRIDPESATTAIKALLVAPLLALLAIFLALYLKSKGTLPIPKKLVRPVQRVLRLEENEENGSRNEERRHNSNHT